MAKEIYYHGSSKLFDKFDLSHALEGDGKVKFGFGVYVTSKFSTVAHYAGSRQADHYYVYAVEVLEKKEDNFLSSNQPVAVAINEKAEKELGKATPEEYLEEGKFVRKYIALTLAGKRIPPNPDNAKPKLDAEKDASAFLLGIGVDFFEWPTDWKHPEKGSHRCILDDKAIKN